jgi:selenocysteine-specific elongation factor
MIVGTAGHIDHGKTALVKALTGVDADRLPEEKRRGITIDLGFAYHPLASGEVLGFVDVPGHERFVHNMLAGATGIDFVLLVVAADDGVMPQTREHLQIVDLLGLAHGAIALTKCDLVDGERVAVASAEIRALLARTTLAGAEVLPVSAVTGQGVADLAARLEGAAAERKRGAARGRFRLAIDRRFVVEGHGTVVTGTVVAGRVKVDDRLLLSPAGREVRVRRIHAQNRLADEGVAGQRCAINLAGVEIDAIARGDWLVDPALHAPADRLDVRLRLLDAETKALAHWAQVHVHLGAAHAMARVALLDTESLKPGGAARAQLVLDRPIGALHGDRFILRDSAARRTMAGGRVLDPWGPPRHRRTPERLAVLAALDADAPVAALTKLIAAPPGWIDLAQFARAWNLAPDEADAAWKEAGLAVARDAAHAYGVAPARWTELGRKITDALAQQHKQNPDSPGLDATRLRVAVEPKLPPPLMALALNARAAAKAIVADGPWYRLPSHQVTLGPAEERLWARILPAMRGAKFEPPRVRDFAKALGAKEDDVRTLLKRLARMGKVVLVAHDHYYLRETVVEMVRLALGLARKAEDGHITAAMFRDAIGTGRKLAILILEFFDRMGITVRSGDLRRVRTDRINIFGKVE